MMSLFPYVMKRDRRKSYKACSAYARPPRRHGSGHWCGKGSQNQIANRVRDAAGRFIGHDIALFHIAVVGLEYTEASPVLSGKTSLGICRSFFSIKLLAARTMVWVEQ